MAAAVAAGLFAHAVHQKHIVCVCVCVVKQQFIQDNILQSE